MQLSPPTTHPTQVDTSGVRSKVAQQLFELIELRL